MEDTRKFTNILRNQHRFVTLNESIDDTTKNTIIGMFKDNVDETTNIESVSLTDGIFKTNGLISLEIRFDITITNSDNSTICNLWFPNNTIELTKTSANIIVGLYNYFNNTLVKYVRENII